MLGPALSCDLIRSSINYSDCEVGRDRRLKKYGIAVCPMTEFCFEGAASWKGETECDLSIRGKSFVTVSPPPEFGGKQGYCVPEEVFAASLASCMNTIFLLIAGNSGMALSKLETKASVKMTAEGLEKLVFTHIHFAITVKLTNDSERERRKAQSIYEKAKRICPLQQSWGDRVPIDFELAIQ